MNSNSCCCCCCCLELGRLSVNRKNIHVVKCIHLIKIDYSNTEMEKCGNIATPPLLLVILRNISSKRKCEQNTKKKK